jgi:hypothetical protein
VLLLNEYFVVAAVVYFVIDSVRKLLVTPLYLFVASCLIKDGDKFTFPVEEKELKDDNI